jgi:hypothetical protein
LDPIFAEASGSIGRLSRRVSDTLSRFARTFGGLSDAFAGLLGCPSRSLSGRLRSLPCSFTYLLGGLAGALTDIFHRRLGP